MHYLLSYTIDDERNDMSLKGTIYDKENNVINSIFNQGKAIKKTNEEYTIIVNKKDSLIGKRQAQDKVSSSVIDAGFLFLISPKAQATLINSDIKNIEYVNVTIKNGTEPFLEGYKIVNIIDKIDCANPEESDLTFYNDGEIDSIIDLVLIEEKIPSDVKIFLLGNKTSPVIIVHESLKSDIETAGLTGFKFFPLDESWELY